MGKETIRRKNECESVREDLQNNETALNSSGLPNSLVMRIMELPDAEAEADDLSAGVRSQTPAGLRKEMGNRLGSDFSGVRFHSDSASVREAPGWEPEPGHRAGISISAKAVFLRQLPLTSWSTPSSRAPFAGMSLHPCR